MKLRLAEIHYAWYERLFMRVLFAAVIHAHILGSLSRSTISRPNGFARLIDLRFLLDPTVFAVCRYLLLGALLLYVLRIGWSFVLPYRTLVSVAVGSIVNSDGAIAHYMQIVSIVLCAQTAAHFCSWLKCNAPVAASDQGEDRVIFWSQQAVVAT